MGYCDPYNANQQIELKLKGTNLVLKENYRTRREKENTNVIHLNGRGALIDLRPEMY